MLLLFKFWLGMTWVDKLSLVNLVNKSIVDMPIDSRVLNNGEYIELRHCC